MAKRLTQEEFIEKARAKHGDKYDYSKVEYKNYETEITIICPEHGEFTQTPNNHLAGKGCRKCSLKNKPQCQPKSCEDFIKKAIKRYGEKYDYSKVDYKGGLIEVNILCKKHNYIFQQKPQNHLNLKSAGGCPMCAEEKRGSSQRLTKEEFIFMAEKIYGDAYDYSLVEYINSDTKVKIICKTHGIFEITPYHHIKRKQGCSKCKSSGLETWVRNILSKNNIDFEEQKTFPWLIGEKGWPLKYDFYLPKHNIAIECQGLQHIIPCDFFGGLTAFEDLVKRDEIKRIQSKKHNVRLLYFTNEKTDFPYYIIRSERKLLEEINAKKYRPIGKDLVLL